MLKVKIPFALLLVTIFALLRGILFYNHFLGREVYFYSDNAIYAILAQRFLDGDIAGAFHPYWNTGFSLATIPFYFLTGSWENAQILLSMVSIILLIFVSYFTLKKVNSTLAVTASFFIAFSSGIEKLTYSWGATEPLYILLFWLSIYFGWQAIVSKKLKYYSIAGLLFGISYFVRTEAMFTFALFLSISFWSLFVSRRKQPLIKSKIGFAILTLALISRFSFRATRGGFFAICFISLFVFNALFKFNFNNFFKKAKFLTVSTFFSVAFFILVNLPYAAVISSHLNTFTLSGKYSFFGSGPPFKLEERLYTTYAQDVWSIDYPNYKSTYYEKGKFLPIFWKYFDSGLDAAYKRAGEYISGYAHGNIFSNLDAYLAVVGITVALFLGIRKKYRILLYFLVMLAGSFAWITYFMDIAYRYLAFSFPIFHAMQGVALLMFSRSITKKLRYIFLAIFMSLYLLSNVQIPSLTSVSRTTGNFDQKMIGMWLKDHNIKLFMGRTEALQFYAEAKMVYIPFAPPQVIVDFAKAWGVEYMVSRPVESSWDYMKDIASPKYKNKDLTLMHSFEDGTLVWKISLTEDEKVNNLRSGAKKFRSTEVY